MYICSKCIQYTIHWDKTQVLKKITSGQTRAQTHHSFIFKLRFLYELNHKIRLSKTVCGIFHFRFRFIFIKVYIFVQQNALTRWLWNVITSFKIKIIEKPQSFVPRRLIFKLQQEVLIFNDICVSWSSPKLTWWQIF